MQTFTDMDAFKLKQEADELDWCRPWYVKSSDDATSLLDQTKRELGRFAYHMRVGGAKQWNNMFEGRVWAPLVLGQEIPALNTLCEELIGPRVDMMASLGAVAKYMDTPWLHGMREDKVFSSNTPQFTSTLIICASSRQDVICAPDFQGALPAGFGGNVDAFLAHLKDAFGGVVKEMFQHNSYNSIGFRFRV